MTLLAECTDDKELKFQKLGRYFFFLISVSREIKYLLDLNVKSDITP